LKHGFVIAAAVALASAPALAQSPIPLHRGSADYPATSLWTQPSPEVAQAQVPAYPPVPVAPLPSPPPAGQTGVPAPAAAPSLTPSYVWEAGHWAWDGYRYVWQPGRYVESAGAAASLVPGQWDRQANGLTWTEGRREYPEAGSSTPPRGYPAAR
jgi:WXXGXW repeat (2 copies)